MTKRGISYSSLLLCKDRNDSIPSSLGMESSSSSFILKAAGLVIEAIRRPYIVYICSQSRHKQ